jgi:hypothetical protein
MQRSLLKVLSIFVIAICMVAIVPVNAELAQASPHVRPNNIPAELAARGKKLTAFKAVMSIHSEYDNGKSRQNVRGFLLYRRPHDFRFQGTGPSGNPLFELVLRASEFQLYVPMQRKILRGGKNCFYQRFPDVAELQTLIPLALLQWKRVRFLKEISSNAQETVIGIAFRNDSWLATLDSKDLKLLRLKRAEQKGRELTAIFGEFGSGKLGWIPHAFTVNSPRGGWKSTVKIKRLEINPFLVENNFKLDPVFSVNIEKCE